jgi:hypothetical protein
MEKIQIWEPGSRIEKSSGLATLVSETLNLLATLALHMQVELIPWKFLNSLEV